MLAPALRTSPFRIYLLGQSLATTGTWMRNIAQDWLVLQLTGSPAAVGVTMACQFLPVLLFGLHGGLLADRLPARPVLLATQGVNAALAALLATLTVGGVVRVEQVWAVALCGGLVTAVDGPVRQVLVGSVVPSELRANAIALNAAAFHTTRLAGPAIAALLIGTAGPGWAFAAEALCSVGPTVGLLRLRTAGLRPPPRLPRAPGQLRAALAHVAGRPPVARTMVLVGVVGMLGLNFPVVLTAMAGTLGGGATEYALFTVAVAAGSVAGALAAGSRPRARLRPVVAAAAAFGLLQALAGLAPDRPVFLALLVATGAANLAFQALANAAIQAWVDPAHRGRVMGLYLLALTGGTPLGAPLVGAITAAAGGRVGMVVCGLAPALAACAVACRCWVRARGRA